MDKERLFRYLDRKYSSKSEIIPNIPLGEDADAIWADILQSRRERSIELPLTNVNGDPYWYILTSKMISASEVIVDELMEQENTAELHKNSVATIEEIFYTGFMEGAQISVQDAMDFLQSGGEPESVEELILINSRQAAGFAAENMYHAIDSNYLHNLAYFLTEGLDNGSGDYRITDTVEIPSLQGEVVQLPPSAMIPEQTERFAEFLAGTTTHPLIKAAAAQAWVLAYRPFPEGNERLARLLSNVILIRAGYTFFGNISISSVLARTSYEYFRAIANILRTENGADLTYFLEYYLVALSAAVNDMRARREQTEQDVVEAEQKLAVVPLQAAPKSEAETKAPKTVGNPANHTKHNENKAKVDAALDTLRERGYEQFTLHDISIDEDSAEKVHTVLDVLQNNLHEDFGEALRFLAQTCPTDITEALGITDALSVKFEGCYVKRVESSWEQRLDDFKVDVIVSADFMLKVPAEHYCGDKTMLVYRDTRRTIDYRFRYTFDLYGVNGYKTCSGPITAPVQYFPEDRITAQREWTTNRILRPNLTAKDFPILARKMLQDIYPEALETPTRLDGELLVKRLSRWLKKRYSRMKLRLRKEHLGKGDGVKGRIIFSDMEVLDGDGEPIKFKAGDIVVNLDEMRFDTDVLVTIVHECVHVYIDLPFFMLQLMAGKPHYSFIDRTSRWLKSERKRQGSDYQMELIEEMEKQDEKLTAYVMMEEGVFRSECDRMFAMTGNDRTPPALMWMLENLSATFGASMQMTKIHMKEVGIPQAEGIWNFIGNRIRVPDHAVSGVWSCGIVYTIDTPDAIALTSSSQRFAQVLLSGKYIYLEGHYVLNRPKYVETASDGTLSLTPYAHEHIEECCLAFRPRRRRKYYEYSCGTAARTKKEGNDKYKTVELVSEPGDADYDSENMSFSDNAQLWGELAGSLHGTFHDALQMVLDEIGVSQTTLASRMGVSRQAFQKWLKRDLMMKRHVVGICIALRLDMGVSLKLIELASLRLGCYGPDPIYLHLLCDRNMTVERGNDILVAQNYKKLNDGRQFEFDLLDFDPTTQEELRRKYGIADEK